MQDYSLLLRLSTLGPFVAVDTPVVLHPEAPEGRLNDGGPQLLHDTNLTVAHFLAEHDVPEELATMATRRAMTRAWLWAKRREGVDAAVALVLDAACELSAAAGAAHEAARCELRRLHA